MLKNVRISKFKDLAVALKELEPFIRNAEHLQTGKPFAQLGGLRSREILGNWLICVVANAARSADRFTLTSDPEGGDGLIYDAEEKYAWSMEHVLIPRPRDVEVGDQDVKKLILAAIGKKQAKGGKAYASGKTLVVLREAAGKPWYPARAVRELPAHDFDDVWVVGLITANEGRYVYGVTRLNRCDDVTPIWEVHVSADFASWEVRRIQ